MSPTSSAPTNLEPSNMARFAGADWFDFRADTSTDPAADRLHARLADTLGEILNSERLIVLTGLGTSMGLVSKVGTISTPISAPTMATLYSAVSRIDDFDHVSSFASSAISEEDVEALLSACQFQIALTPSDEKTAQFLSRAESEILKLCGFIDDKVDLTNHEIFLRKLARRQTRLERPQIYTTNYDLAFERAAHGIRYKLVDGFGFGENAAFDGNSFDLDVVRRRRGQPLALEPNVVQLLKLHGSVDWHEERGDVFRRAMPENPVLIYPSQNKYQSSFRPPYLECMSRLQGALREPEVGLVVVGFGFNDAHITAPIEAAIRSNVGLRLAVVRPDLSVTSNPTCTQLRHLADAGDRRITLIESTFADFVGLLPDVSPLDEREQHDDRVRRSMK